MLNLAVIMCVFVRSYFISGRLGMLLSGLWLRIFLVQGRCGQKDPRKLPTNCLGRSWRILGVSRTVCITYKMQHRAAQARERCRWLSSSARVWGQRPGQLKEAYVIGKKKGLSQ